MGVITALLLAGHIIHPSHTFTVPIQVILAAATAIGLGSNFLEDGEL